jgi:RecF/RecN/SMC N terminal domain
MALRVQRIDVQGFRSFGTGRQSFALSDTVTALWGGNSQGKTSLAEALEFLLTGQIARRELLASAKDEFSHSLRNAHMALAMPVFVEAEFVCTDGKTRKLRRSLVADFDGNAPCQTKLELEGSECNEPDIESVIGIKLLHPPLRAPVLAQHTLGYVFSASPTDRAAYFRAVLDTQDLEDFRAAVASLIGEVPRPGAPEMTDLAAAGSIQEIADEIAAIEASEDENGVNSSLADALRTLLGVIGVKPASTLEGRIDQLAEALESRRQLAFPLNLFIRKPFAGWTAPLTALDGTVTTFETERSAVDVETRRLVSLFESALSLPAITHCTEPIDCPVCGAEGTLTPERVMHIRDQVAANKAYQDAERAVTRELRAIDSKIQALADNAELALPKFMQVASAERRKEGFRADSVATLSGDAAATESWLAHSRTLWRRTAELHRLAKHARILLKQVLNDITHWNDPAILFAALSDLERAQSALEAAHTVYGPTAQVVGSLLKSAVDQSAHTNGWDELGRLAKDPAALFKALGLGRAYDAKVKALEQALRQIDVGNGAVSDEKFSDLSSDVSTWWERLRPGEPTFFSSVRRRSARARRTIDLKVSMSATEDRSDPKLRDAVAVFSQSQLHCLGLSLFLARAIDGGAGFVLLDDPVLTSDDDFRPNFASTVIEALLDAGIQIIVVTQDHSSWKDIGHRWSHRGAVQFQMVRDNPVIGTEIRSQSDALATLLAQAQPFINSQDGEQRKNGATKLRQAIERFSKELLVRSRHARGEQLAMITDYDGQNFGNFSGQALALLTKDPSHPGKLVAAHSYVTPGPHDDTPPSTGQLKMAAGDLKFLKKQYLG